MTQLSERQFAMLRTFVDEGVGYAMSLESAARFDQRPFRSMLKREYITYKASKGFMLTKMGHAAWTNFQAANIIRKDPKGALTSYFDPEYYKLHPAKVNMTQAYGARA